MPEPQEPRQGIRGSVWGFSLVVVYVVLESLARRLPSDAAGAAAQLALVVAGVVVLGYWFRSRLRQSAADARRQDEGRRRSGGTYQPGVPESRGLLVVPFALAAAVITVLVLALVAAAVDKLL